MKKSTKGALAAGTAAVLLTGGVGSLAYWTDSATVGGTDVTSGQLKLGVPDCDPGVGTGSLWTLDGGDVFVPATDRLVPGDTLTKVCTFTVTATGNHLAAELTTNTPGVSDADEVNALTQALAPSATFVIDGEPTDSISSADDNKTLTATLTLTFNGASGNTSQNLQSTLDSFVITATQVHGN